MFSLGFHWLPIAIPCYSSIYIYICILHFWVFVSRYAEVLFFHSNRLGWFWQLVHQLRALETNSVQSSSSTSSAHFPLQKRLLELCMYNCHNIDKGLGLSYTNRFMIRHDHHILLAIQSTYCCPRESNQVRATSAPTCLMGQRCNLLSLWLNCRITESFIKLW